MNTAIDTIKRLAAGLVGGQSGKIALDPSGDSALRYAEKVVSQIGALMNEHQRLVGLRDDEVEKTDSLNARLRELEGGRVEALTEHRVSGDVRAREKASNLLEQANKIREELNDVQAIAGGIERRIADLDGRMEPLKRMYSVAMGAFLNAIYRQLSDRYNQLAPEVSEIVLQIGALRRVMLRYLAGNTNGWDGRVLLPGIEPGEGRYIKPVLDADSADFARAANERMDQIFEQMRSAGFIWRFD